MLKIQTARDSVFTDRTDVYQLLYVREQTSYSVDDPINSGNDTKQRQSCIQTIMWNMPRGM